MNAAKNAISPAHDKCHLTKVIQADEWISAERFIYDPTTHPCNFIRQWRHALDKVEHN
jgi:hypothetical protein